MLLDRVGVDVSSQSPNLRPVRSVLMHPARRTAPSIFRRPAPCSRLLNPHNVWAVYSSTAFARFGVRYGFFWKTRAAAPATAGVDTDVPLRNIIPRSGLLLTCASNSGLAVTIALGGSPLALIILFPGATRSGL